MVHRNDLPDSDIFGSRVSFARPAALTAVWNKTR